MRTAGQLQKPECKRGEVAGLHSSADETHLSGLRVAAASGKLGPGSKGEGSGAAGILFCKESLGAVRLDTSWRRCVFLLSIINHRNQSGRIGVLAIVPRAGPRT